MSYILNRLNFRFLLKARFLITLFVAFSALNICFNMFLYAASEQDSKSQNSDFAKEDSGKGISKLELAGSEPSGYDVGNKIRKAKSNVNIGLGLNIINKEKKAYFNTSATLGYSYFFHKTLGLRGYTLFDHRADGFYSGLGVDAMWDFLQTEPFGMGILGGTSLGYYGIYRANNAVNGGLLAQAHLGLSLIFDGGKSRLEGLIRIPYATWSGTTKSSVMYIVMYSYTF